MQKDYTGWHAYSLKLQNIRVNQLPLFHAREIWWCSLGINIGDEENGKNELFERPLLIIRKFNDHLFTALPLTTHVRDEKFYFTVTSGSRLASVILSHPRTLDARRLRRLIGSITKKELTEILKKFGVLYTIPS